MNYLADSITFWPNFDFVAFFTGKNFVDGSAGLDYDSMKIGRNLPRPRAFR